MKKLFLLILILSSLTFAIPDPSAVYCEKKGYNYTTIQTEIGEKGVCILEDGSRISSWKLLENENAYEIAEQYALEKQKPVTTPISQVLKYMKPEKGEKTTKSPEENYGLPAAVDLTVNLPPIKSQGAQGSCVSWSVGYYYKTYKDTIEEGWDPSLSTHQCSPAFLYNLVNDGEDTGSNLAENYGILSDYGCPNLSSMPYSAGDHTHWPDYTDWKSALRYKINSYNMIFHYFSDYPDINQLKTILNSGEIFSIATSYWTSSMTTDTETGISCILNKTSGTGSHALTIVGYNDTIGEYNGERGSFYVANSYGTDFGCNGFLWIPYNWFYYYGREAWNMSDLPNKMPNGIAEVNFTHGDRSDIRFKIGDYNSRDATWSETFLYRMGGSNSYDGTFVFELNDSILPPSSERPWYLNISDKSGSGTGTVRSFKIIYDNITYASNETDVSTVDDGTIEIYIEEQEAIVITIESPENSTYTDTFLDFNITLNKEPDWCGTEINGTSNITMEQYSSTKYNLSKNMSETQHYVKFYCNSSSGLVYNSSIVYFTVNTSLDLSTPSIEIENPQNTTVNQSQTLNFSASDNSLDKCWYLMNNNNYEISGCSNLSTIVNEQEGFNHLIVWVNDTNNNTNSSSVNYTLDTSIPQLDLQRPQNITYNYNQSLPLNYTAVDNSLDTIWYQLDTGSLVELAGNTTFNTSEGSHLLQLWANDTAGNVNSTTKGFSIDMTGIAIELANPENTTYSSLSVAVNYSYSEQPNWCGYELNGAGNITTNCQNTTITASEGFNQIKLSLNDSYGNMNSSAVNFSVDTIKPQIEIQLPLNSSYNYTPSLNYTVSDTNLDSCWYSNTTDTNISLGSCSNLSEIGSEGWNNVTVWVNDTAGNTNSSSVSFSIDSTKPIISSIRNGSVAAISSRILWSTNEPANSTVLFSLNSSNLSSSISNTSFILEYNLTLQYLSKNNTYFYMIKSCDSTSNCNTSSLHNLTTPTCSSDWDCGSWSVCSGGLQTRTCTDNNQCQYPWTREESQSCTISSSSGGGGGGSTITTKESKPSKETKIWEILNPFEKITFKTTKPSFTKIDFSIKEKAVNIQMKINEENNKLDSVSVPTKLVYKYLNIETNGLNESIIDNATIEFSVNKSWLNSNNLDKSSVVLERYNNSWEQLDTELKEEGTTRIVYEATTPGFSVFAITAEEVSETTTATTTETTVESEVPDITTEPGGEEDYTWIIVLVILAVIAIGGYLFYHYEHAKNLYLKSRKI